MISDDIEMKETRITFFIDEECCICLENLYKNSESGSESSKYSYKSNDYIKMLCCKKNLHKDCLLKSFLVNPKCCLCRSEINIKKHFNDKLILKIFNTYTHEFRSEHVIQIESLISKKITIDLDYKVYFESEYKPETNICYDFGALCSFSFIFFVIIIITILITIDKK
jgi:hypothetical protein